MLETLTALDQAVFLFLNVTLANPVTDVVMPIVTSDILLRCVYLVALVGIIWKGDARLRWLILFSLLALLAADQISSSLLKPMIGRIRPCHTLDGINLLVRCGGGKSMPSSHAANAFTQAVLFSLLYPKTRVYLLSFAGIVAISRVYVGVHYPGDVLAGSLLGATIGLTIAIVYRKYVMGRIPVRKTGGES